ncbi:MAG: hypothetical protein CL388_04160 [Acidiferrobacteraceae bacterium]|nr:hypothetical protein [Acidiferrobacteraceae bacterium]
MEVDQRWPVGFRFRVEVGVRQVQIHLELDTISLVIDGVGGDVVTVGDIGRAALCLESKKAIRTGHRRRPGVITRHTSW